LPWSTSDFSWLWSLGNSLTENGESGVPSCLDRVVGGLLRADYAVGLAVSAIKTSDSATATTAIFIWVLSALSPREFGSQFIFLAATPVRSWRVRRARICASRRRAGVLNNVLNVFAYLNARRAIGKLTTRLVIFALPGGCRANENGVDHCLLTESTLAGNLIIAPA
jgi:hypothetical protein